MKPRQKNLVAGILVCLAGIFLIYKNSLGKYFDPWMSNGSKYKGHMSYWVIVIGIGMIIIGLLITIMGSPKMPAQKKN